jgi:hypothetical protein
MARDFKETAHLNTDLQKYGDNYDRIFKKKSPEGEKMLKIPKYPELSNSREIIKELEQQLKQTQNRLKDAERVIEFYCDIANWDNSLESYDYQSSIIASDKELIKNREKYGGRKAREYFMKYGDSDEQRKARKN